MALKDLLPRGLIRQDEQSQRRVTRFWVERGKVKEIVILDSIDDIVGAYEHRVLRVDSKVDYILCMRNFDHRCKLCEAGNKRYFVWYISVLDVTGYVGRDGRQHRWVKCVLPLKKRAAEAFRTQIDLWKKKYGNDFDLRYAHLYVSRLALRDSPSSGDRFELIDVLTPERIREIAGDIDLSGVDISEVVRVFNTPRELEDYYNDLLADIKEEEDDVDDSETSEVPF